ncbi:site-specific integrase [Vibrio splendidus]
MATKVIELVKTQKGTRYKARIRVTSFGKAVKQNCKTFDTYQQAEVWLEKATSYVEKQGINGLKKLDKLRETTIGDVLHMVLTQQPTASNLGSSKKSNLNMLVRCSIAKLPVEALSATELYKHCLFRSQSVKPQTVSQDLSNLSTALKDAATFYGISYDGTVFSDARSSLQRHGFIGRSKERSRRLELCEQRKINDYLELESVTSTSNMPLWDIYYLALETGMRLGEIPKLLGSDVCQHSKRLTVRNRKHPKNHLRITNVIPLSEKALEVLSNQPKRADDLLFPYTAKAIGYQWRKLTKTLEIDDLHFHDLRTEAACRMFESGLSAVEISKITGHRDLNILNNHYLPLCVKLSKAA